MKPKRDKRNVKREGWETKILGQESSYEDETEIKRRIIRSDETKGNPNNRDIAGVVPYKDTMQGRKELEEAEEAESKKKRASE